MKLLLDQGLPRSTVLHLHNAGIEAVHVGDRGLATAIVAKAPVPISPLALGGEYFFWSGHGDLASAVKGYQRSFRKLFRIADIRNADDTRKRCRSHMFRDTFAVELLLAGVPIDQVSVLVGHRSVKMTEKHYLPWVQARQKQLTASVRRLVSGGEVARYPANRGYTESSVASSVYFVQAAHLGPTEECASISRLFVNHGYRLLSFQWLSTRAFGSSRTLDSG